jgi:hypothetical protein
MVEKRLSDYYDRIIEKMPALQQVDKETAYRIIEKTVKRYFKTIRGKLNQNPYTHMCMKGAVVEFYIRKRDAYRQKKKIFRRQNLLAFYESVDVDETHLPEFECSQFKEWERDSIYSAGGEQGKIDPGE